MILMVADVQEGGRAIPSFPVEEGRGMHLPLVMAPKPKLTNLLGCFIMHA